MCVKKLKQAALKGNALFKISIILFKCHVYSSLQPSGDSLLTVVNYIFDEMMQ